MDHHKVDDHDEADNHDEADDHNEADNNGRDFAYDTTGNRLKCSHSICSSGMYVGGQPSSNWYL